METRFLPSSQTTGRMYNTDVYLSLRCEKSAAARHNSVIALLGINYCLQKIETGFAEWFYASHSMGPAQILLKISTRIGEDLSNDITLNPPLFSFVNTLKVWVFSWECSPSEYIWSNGTVIHSSRSRSLLVRSRSLKTHNIWKNSGCHLKAHPDCDFFSDRVSGSGATETGSAPRGLGTENMFVDFFVVFTGPGLWGFRQWHQRFCPQLQSNKQWAYFFSSKNCRVRWPVLKGLCHEMDFAFETCMVSSRPKYGTRRVFTFFSCSNDFITQKVYFSRLLRVYVGLMACS